MITTSIITIILIIKMVLILIKVIIIMELMLINVATVKTHF